MALKTFNINPAVYKKFSEYCKKEGISMSKKIENFIANELKNVLQKEHSEKVKEIPIEEKKEIKEHSFAKYC